MNKNNILDQLIVENNGYLLTSMAIREGITKPYLAKYVKEKGMEKVARGIYIMEDVWPDELYIMQMRNHAVIYSGETALYLHNLLDREYAKICITVPTGYNAAHLKGDNVQVKYTAKCFHKMGVCMRPSSSGNMVMVYDKERCICELIANRNKTEIQDFQTAIKEYMTERDKRLSRLMEYAEKLGIRDMVMKYVEVLV